jgi:hypothetical protein
VKTTHLSTLDSVPRVWPCYRVIPALVGTLVWLFLVVFRPPGMLQGTAELTLLAAPLLAIPLSMESQPDWQRRFATASAALLIGSYYLAPGLFSGLFALPWVMFSVVAFFARLDGDNARVLARIWRSLRYTADVPFLLDLTAHAYLIVGALWACASRFQMTPLGFHEPWVVLTANHFHYAGYCVSILGARAAELALKKNALSNAFAWTLRFMGLGPPIVAIGITGVPLLEVISSVVLALSLTTYAWIMMTSVTRHVEVNAARLFLRVSSLCLFFTMAAACIYTVGHYIGRELFSIVLMIRIHGMVNAGGFALLGLLGFAVEARGTRHSVVPLSKP